MKAYEVPAKRFTEAASPELLKQLDTHYANYTKFNREGNSELAKKELNQGKRIVLQLEAILSEIQDVRNSLKPEDERLFSQKIVITKQKVLTAIEKFNKLNKPTASSHIATEQRENESLESTQLKQKILLEEIKLEEQKAQLEAVENLQKDIVELNELFVEFSKQVENQGETVDVIENNVEGALNHIEDGVRHLEKAAKLKTALYPLTGALLGTCIGGPVGLIAGLKVGAAAALGGTVLGFAGGRFLKKNQEEAVTDSTMTKTQSMPTNMDSLNKTSLTNSNTFTNIEKHRDACSHLHND